MSELHQETFKQEKIEIEVNGYIIVEGILSQDEATEMREVLAQLDQESGIDHRHLGTDRLIAKYDPVFFKTIDHPKVLPLIEHFMG